MGEIPDPAIGNLQPGDVIELADNTELPAFEDLLAMEVDPKHDPVLWATRPPIRDLIRPPDFYGPITDIRLTVMDEPYERLQDARARGWKFAPGAVNFALSSQFKDELVPRYRGFTMTANALTAGRGSRGQIQAELWYYPLPLVLTSKAGSTHRAWRLNAQGEKVWYEYTSRADRVGHLHTGEAIRRVVTKPKYEVQKFIELGEKARRIGLAALRRAIAHPLPGHFESRK